MPAPVFTSIGLVTSLGHDAVTVAAAARAGIVRPAPLLVWVDNAETDDPEPVVGHPVDELADGFDGMGRLLRLAELGLMDLLTTTPPEVLKAAHWLVALPESLSLTPPPDLSDLDAPPVPQPEVSPQRLPPEHLRGLIERVTGVPLPPARLSVFDGRVGVIRALGHAQRLCEQGQICIVGAVDTLVDSEITRTLYAHGRLLSGGNGVGLQPGEAAAFVTLEPIGPRPALGRPGAGALGPDHLYSGRPALGKGLAATAKQLPSREAAWPLSDCNGEIHRSTEWGYAAIQNEVLRSSLDHATYPATSVGDTGAASPAVGLVLALRAFARGYAPTDTALLLAADALGPRGILTIHAI